MDTPVSLLVRLRSIEDEAAWHRFVELYTPLFYAWARKLDLQTQDAADLVQDVFALLVRKLPAFQYDPAKSFHKWLRTLWLNHWRNACRDRHAPLLTAVSLQPEDVAAVDDVTALEEAEYRDFLVRRALELMQQEFEPATWQACWQFVVEDRPAAEVAQRLGISTNAVYLAKCRVIRRLRQALDGLVD